MNTHLNTTRVDVLSLKGGVGKTSAALAIAIAQARKTKKSVLFVDADLTGTCIGHLVDYDVPWLAAETLDLNDCLCAPPETLAETLDGTTPPIYLWPRKGANGSPECLSKDGDLHEGVELLLCPSCYQKAFSPTKLVLQLVSSMAAQERSVGWVTHVVDEVCRVTAKTLASKGQELGGIVVDHSPGMGAIQEAVWNDVIRKRTGAKNRKVLLVSLPTQVDLRGTEHLVGMCGGNTDGLTLLVNKLDVTAVGEGGDLKGALAALASNILGVLGELVDHGKCRALPFSSEFESGFAGSEQDAFRAFSKEPLVEDLREYLFK